MPRYLTAEWLDAAQRALDDSPAVLDASREVKLTVQQIVTDGPDGDVAFHVEVDHGRIRVAGGEAADPTVTFIQKWDTAGAVARGDMSAQGAFMTGLIRVRGDLPKLVEHSDVFGGVDDVLAELRTQTEY